jgi:hypothetical protein
VDQSERERRVAATAQAGGYRRESSLTGQPMNSPAIPEAIRRPDDETFIQAVRTRFREGCPIGRPLVEIPADELKITPDKRVLVDLEVLLGLLR